MVNYTSWHGGRCRKIARCSESVECGSTNVRGSVFTVVGIGSEPATTTQRWKTEKHGQPNGDA